MEQTDYEVIGMLLALHEMELNKYRGQLSTIPHWWRNEFFISNPNAEHASTSYSARRYNHDTGAYNAFFALPVKLGVKSYSDIELVMCAAGFAWSFTLYYDHEAHMGPYHDSLLEDKPLTFFDCDLRLTPNEKNDAQRFFYCISQPGDPIESIFFYDLEKGGGYGIAGGKELEACKKHEIKVQTTADGRQYVDLYFQGGDAQFTLYAKSQKGVISNMAVLRNGANAALAGNN